MKKTNLERKVSRIKVLAKTAFTSDGKLIEGQHALWAQDELKKLTFDLTKVIERLDQRNKELIKGMREVENWDVGFCRFMFSWGYKKQLEEIKKYVGNLLK